MVTLEQVEKLRQRANISYEEARAALEATNGDILEAVINLEKQNRIQAPEGGGYYNSKNEQQASDESTYAGSSDQKYKGSEGSTFGEMVGRFLKWCERLLHKGNVNRFEVQKNNEKIIVIPVTVLVLLLVFAFWITVPIAVVGIFFGYRYGFSGPDLGNTEVNKTMDSVANAAENLKKNIADCKGDNENGENSNH